MIHQTESSAMLAAYQSQKAAQKQLGCAASSSKHALPLLPITTTDLNSDLLESSEPLDLQSLGWVHRD